MRVSNCILLLFVVLSILHNSLWSIFLHVAVAVAENDSYYSCEKMEQDSRWVIKVHIYDDDYRLL